MPNVVMRLSKIHFRHIFPTLCSIASLVLVSLCIAAGNTPGFIEEYAVVRVSLSYPLPYLVLMLYS